MKKLIAFSVMFLVSLLLFAACENNDEPVDVPPGFIGTWCFEAGDNADATFKYLVLQEDNVYRKLYRDADANKTTVEGTYSLVDDDQLLIGGDLFSFEYEYDGPLMYLFANSGDTSMYRWAGFQNLIPDWSVYLDTVAIHNIPQPQIPYYCTMTTDGSALYLLYANNFAHPSTDGASIFKCDLQGDSLALFTGSNHIGYAVTYGDGSLWTTHAGFIIELDPETGDSLNRIDLSFDTPLNPIVWKDGSLYGYLNYATPPLYQIDLADGSIVREIDIPGCRDLALKDGRIVGSNNDEIVQLDLESGTFDYSWYQPFFTLDGTAFVGPRFYTIKGGYRGLILFVLE